MEQRNDVVNLLQIMRKVKCWPSGTILQPFATCDRFCLDEGRRLMSILNWFRPKAEPNRAGCTHYPERKDFTIKVLGADCTFESAAICASCLERYLNQYSTLCAHCERPIFPGEPVEGSWIDAPHPYVHSTFKCGEGIFWCGTWGEGRLIPIEETHDVSDDGYAIEIRPKKIAA